MMLRRHVFPGAVAALVSFAACAPGDTPADAPAPDPVSADLLNSVQSPGLGLEATVAGLHPIARAQVRQLTALLLHPLGRRLLAGLDEDWPRATVATVAESLQAMRVSSLALRQQAFQALRELTNGAYFAHPETWGAIGYPGPLAL